MPGTVTVNVPLKSYLTKYLSQKYGGSHCVTRRSWLGKYIVDVLDKQYRRKPVNLSKESYYQLNIPPSIVNREGFSFSSVKQKSLEEMIEKVFRNDMYGYIEVSMGADLKFINPEHNSLNKQSTVQAINQFLRFYNISEDELSPESIYRDFFRHKKVTNP
ncbi:hypothetical protein HCG49_16970 [Arenibacter sp. 6A1]|uniref:hypothetical protein n=1 Tax=Arenibacter sp. 6A1 TaxID=2720391 RepID=UPI0014462DB5|nr:hypothetical protein [Arenibacter sp. 6A1]NKI28248.1 hypothetical protein [Arenibacter sp. 6A1]